MIGKQLLNYEIKAIIGEGGMGKVYLAEDLKLHKKVAIKSLLPQFVNDDNLRARFIQDAKIISELKHPNIVSLYHFHEDESGLYLIMEFVEGQQLDDYILHEKGIVPYQEAIALITQVLKGLETAHRKKIIHRDIKPSNIILNDKQEVKIIDFGIAKMLDSDENLAKTMSAQEIGTPRYMSPEQILGKSVDIQTDIYSAGLVLYEMLTGKCPYAEVTNIYALNKQIVEDVLPIPSEVYPFIPKTLDAVVMRSIAKNVDERYKNCGEFLQALKSISLETALVHSVSIELKNAKKPLILFGNTHQFASKAVFEFTPGENYNLFISEEGKKTIHKELKLTGEEKEQRFSFTLENLNSGGQNSAKLNRILLGTGVLFLLLFAYIMYLTKENKTLKSSETKLKNELRLYEL